MPAGSRCASRRCRHGRRAHFAEAAEIAETPISVARAAYWQGRAAEALGEADERQGAIYERAALQPIAYYGQLARARLGEASLPLRAPRRLDGAARAAFDDRLCVRALRLLRGRLAQGARAAALHRRRRAA